MSGARKSGSCPHSVPIAPPPRRSGLCSSAFLNFAAYKKHTLWTILQSQVQNAGRTDEENSYSSLGLPCILDGSNGRSAPYRIREGFATIRPEQSPQLPYRLWLIRLRDHRTPVDLFTRDRKSTRLNSSHVAISYAVFCLKKKKNLTY